MEYEKELEVGVRVVQLACCLCQKIQKGSFGPNPDLVVSKLDDSPVTVAGMFFLDLMFFNASV